MSKYYILNEDKKEIGPYDIEYIHRLFKLGDIDKETYIREDNDKEFKQLKDAGIIQLRKQDKTSNRIEKNQNVEEQEIKYDINWQESAQQEINARRLTPDKPINTKAEGKFNEANDVNFTQYNMIGSTYADKQAQISLILAIVGIFVLQIILQIISLIIGSRVADSVSEDGEIRLRIARIISVVVIVINIVAVIALIIAFATGNIIL